MYSLSTSSSLCPRMKKRRMKVSQWDILPTGTFWPSKLQIHIKRLSKKMTFIYKRLARDATICFAWILYFSTHFNRGNTPIIPQYTTWRQCITWKVRVPSTEVPMKAKLVWIFKVLLPYVVDSYIKRLKQVSTKEARPRECQESGFVLKVILSDPNRFQGQWMPNYKR